MATQLKDKHVLCVGLCVLDIIHVCNSFPVEDSDKRSKHGRWQRGGNASNICTVLSQLGEKCEFIGSLPNNKMFQFVIEDCLDRGILMDYCVYHDNPQSPIATVLLNDESGSRTIIFSNPNLPILTFEDFRKVDLRQYKWIHFEARNPKETVQMIDLIVQWNKTNNKITISVEFEKPRKEILILAEHADVIFVGKDFASHLGYTKESAVYEIQKYANNTTSKIICPWGSEGAVCLDTETGSFNTVPAYPPVRVMDSLGAGDTFVAGTLYFLSNGKTLVDAIDFGCRVAGAKVGFYGYDGIEEIFGNQK